MPAQSEDHHMEGVDEAPPTVDKGKGKQAAVEEDSADESSEESGAEDHGAEEVAEDEDTMAEIDPENIVGRRTRGKNIDFAKAAQELGEDEDEDDDEDFQDPEEDKMEE